MKKIVTTALAAAFLATSLIPATAAIKTTTTKAQPAKAATAAKPAHKMGNPAKKRAVCVKKDVKKMDKAMKKACTKKHHKTAAPAASAKKATK